MKTKILICLSGLLLYTGLKMVAQDGLDVLTKNEAFEQMLENNFGIQLADNQVEIAENNTSILNAGYLPTIFTTAGASYDNTTSTTDFNGATNADGDPRPPITLEDAETRRYNAAINLDYTIFDGLGRYYNFKTLKEQYNLTKLQARETIETTTLQLFSVYYEAARLTENVAVLEETLAITKAREQRAQYQFEYGQANKLAVLNAQVDIATDSINLLNARQLLRNTKRDLNVLLNQELETDFEVDTGVEFLEALELVALEEQMLEKNVSILQANQNIVISDYAIKGARSLLLPTIGLTGSYGWNRNLNPASAFFPGTTNSSNSFAIGADLRWNLFDGGQSVTALKNAKIVYKNQELAKSQLEQQVSRDIANAKGDYLNALYIYELQEQNVITNQNNFDRSQEQLKIGQITSVEFRQAQLNLLNAQTTMNAAKYTAKLAELRYLQLVGELLNIAF